MVGGAGPTTGVRPQAKTSGKFSRDELDKLWREFQHHREKVREYDAMLETLSRAEGARPRVPMGPHPAPRSPAGLAVWEPVGWGAETGRDTSQGHGLPGVSSVTPPDPPECGVPLP